MLPKSGLSGTHLYYYSFSFMAIPSVIAVLSLNDQYHYSSFCSSAFVDGYLQSTFYERMPRCSSCRVAILISSAVMQSVMTMHDSYYIDGYVHNRYFFVSQFVYITNLQ